MIALIILVFFMKNSFSLDKLCYNCKRFRHTMKGIINENKKEEYNV